MIDFSDPTSYRGINSDDLAIYVKLEQAHLNREVENVLGEGGTFSTHSTDEFARLQGEFDSAYASYMEGLALMSMGWYRTPIVPGGPDPMTAAKIGACFAGPWAAFAVNAALLAVDTKDGVIAGKHALMQGAVGLAAGMAGPAGILVNIAASGIEYEEGGGIGWSNRQFREGAVRNIASYALSNTLNGAMGPNFSNTALGTGLSAGISGFAMSGLTISSSGWNNMSFGFDTENWKEHATVGIASGISAAVTRSMSKKSNTGSERAQSGNKQGTSMMPEQWGDQFSQKVISGGINSLIMTASYHAIGGDGFKNDYSKMNWNNMAPSAYDLGNFLGSQANDMILNHYQINKDTGARTGNRANDNWFDKTVSSLYEGSIKIDKSIKEFFSDAGKMAVDGLSYVGGKLKDFGKWAVDGLRNTCNSIASVFGGQQSSSDIWKRYFGDNRYMQMSQQEQNQLWKQYSREMGESGFSVEEDENRGMESRYWKRTIKDLKGYKELSEKGVNVIGIRKDSKDSRGSYANTKYDDIFVVMVDGKIKGVYQGSTEPGAASRSGIYTVLNEGQYSYKMRDNTGFQKNLQHENEILTTGNNTASFYDRIGELVSTGFDPDILFHYGGTKSNVGGSSLGCQVIYGGGFLDESGNYVSGRDYTGTTPYSGVRNSRNNQGSYNHFIKQIRDYQTSNNSQTSIQYTLLSEKKLKENTYYNNYRRSMNF